MTNQEMIEALEISKHDHYTEREGLMTCPAGYTQNPGKCDCGADEANARIDAVIAELTAR